MPNLRAVQAASTSLLCASIRPFFVVDVQMLDWGQAGCCAVSMPRHLNGNVQAVTLNRALYKYDRSLSFDSIFDC